MIGAVDRVARNQRRHSGTCTFEKESSRKLSNVSLRINSSQRCAASSASISALLMRLEITAKQAGQEDSYTPLALKRRRKVICFSLVTITPLPVDDHEPGSILSPIPNWSHPIPRTGMVSRQRYRRTKLETGGCTCGTAPARECGP
jgi:hypothetical protein